VINRVHRVDDAVSIARVLVSVADKSGLDGLVRGLVAQNDRMVFYATGGTYDALRRVSGNEGRVRSVSEYTGQPEMQGGLVKTLDFKIYLGLLSETYNDDHAADLARTGAIAFDLVVSSLYPFEKTVAVADVTLEDARANIDIGGVTLVRAAAKNFLRVACLTSPEQYDTFIRATSANGGASTLAQRFSLAREAFVAIADYDRAIATYLAGVPEQRALEIYSFGAEESEKR
jgi:phosphoribosylaminoimidazolecarboxamide formyltransferase / IMP cyclohydrolase